MRRVLAALLIVTFVTATVIPRAVAQTTEADFWVAQAIVEIDDKHYDAALENLRKALAIEPEHVEALYYTGVAYMAMNRSKDAIPFLARARAKAPNDASVALQLGLAYFAQQDYAHAQPLLEAVFKLTPDQEGLGYYVGFMRYRDKDYQGALRAFRATRTTDPELQQLTRLYTGLALAVLGMPAQAAAEMEQAVRLAPGTALTGPAERLRDTVLAQRGAERRFSAEMRLGFYYDTNVAVVPSEDTLEPLVPLLRHPRHDSFGELAGVRFDYVFWKTETWAANVGYSFFGTYNNELPSFNLVNHLVTGGLTRKDTLLGLPVQTGVSYAYDTIFLDHKNFLDRHTITTFGTLVESDRHLTQIFARYQNKDFNELPPEPPGREIRDAANYMIGGMHFLRFAGDKHFIKLGYQFDVDMTEGRNYQYEGHRFLAGGQYTLPWYGIRLKYDLDTHLRNYAHPNTLLPTFDPGSKRRRDTEITNVARIEVPLPYQFLGGGFTIAAEFQSTIAQSNLAVFDYRRDVSSLIASWAY